MTIEKEKKALRNSTVLQKRKPVFCRCQWIVGFILMTLGGIFQIIALPFCDLVLISTNSITAILFNTFLSIRYLGEKFVPKYDVPSFTLMGAGGLTIVLLASHDDKKFTPREIKGQLTTVLSISCTASGFLCLLCTLLYLRGFLKQIKKFELDMKNWV